MSEVGRAIVFPYFGSDPPDRAFLTSGYSGGRHIGTTIEGIATGHV